MKSKIKLIVMLFVLACLSLSVGFACSSKEKEPIKISGFDESVIVSEITVNAGENVSIQSPLVIDENNNVLDVHVLVTDAFGGYVEVKANKFFALDGNGYTIKYLVQTYDGNTHVRTTNVKVNGNFYLGVNMQQVYFIGETITLNEMHRLEDPSISFAVTAPSGQKVTLGGEYKENEEADPIQLDDNQFVATESGFYNLTVTAVENDRTYTYDTVIYVYEYASDYVYGAVEVFDENWETIRKLSGYGMQNWTLTNTKETGVLGPRGTSDWFLQANTQTGWQGGLDFWLNPIFAKENYEALLDEGFTDIIVPVMIKGSNGALYTFTTGHVQNDTSYMYQVHKGGITAGNWVEFKFSITDTTSDWQRSFLSCYDIYANQIAQFLRFSGFSGNCTFYLGSIYAMKAKTLTANESAQDISVDVGHTIPDLGAYIGSNPDAIDVEYRVLFRGDEEIISTKKDAEGNVLPTPYTFAGNGDYVVSVVPARKDYTGGFNFNVEVSDDVTLSYTETADLEYPREANSSRLINFADLGMILKDGQGSVITDVSYEVYYEGDLIDSAELDFTAAVDGKYTVVAIGKYGENKEFVSYKETSVNVYSTTNIGIIDKYKVATVNVVDKINTIMEYSPAKSFTAFKVVRIIGPNEVEIVDAPITELGVLTLTDLNSGYYKIYATDTNNVDEVAYIDIWDSTEGHLFNVVSEDSIEYVLNYHVYSWGTKDYAEYTDITVTEDGKYFANAFPSRGNSTDNAVKVYPLHSRNYYEQFRGLNGTISFDYYIDVNQNTTSYRPIGTSGRPDIGTGLANKISASISLDEFLDNWTDYNSTITTGAYSFLIKELGWVWMDKSTDAITMYVGNFSFTYTEKAQVESKESVLVDVTKLEGNTFDLKQILSEAGKSLMTENPSEAFVYKLVDNGKQVTDLGTNSVITLTEANQRAYTLNIYFETGLLAYQGHVDFYDPSAALVWNVASEDNLSFVVSHARSSCSSNNKVENEGVQSLVTVNGVNYIMSQFTSQTPGRSHVVTSYPLHSDAYYNMYKGQGYEFKFDVILGYNVKNILGTAYIKATSDMHMFGQANGAWRPGFNGISTSETTGLSEVKSLSISLDKLLDNWTEYMSGNPDGMIHSTSGQDFDFLVSSCMEAWRDNPYPNQIYLGNFQLVKNS